MNSPIRTRFVAAAALAVAGFGAASAAHARTDVFFSVGLPATAYVQPAPVYVQPRPVYTQPRVVYTQPEVVYTQPEVVYTQQPVYVESQPVYGYGWEAERARRHEAWRLAEWRRHHPHWNDRDHDRDHDFRGHR